MSAIKLGDESNISILDFGPFLNGGNKQDVGNALFASLRDTGFVYLVNHGLPKDKIDKMFEWSRLFFSQPMETKQLAPHPSSGAHHRGYSAPGREKVSQYIIDSIEPVHPPGKVPDVKESFECGREESEEMPNIWLPEGVLSGFKEACLEFFWLCREVELSVLRALAIGFNLPEDYFMQYHTVAENQLRLLHYPCVPSDALDNDRIARIGAHSDFCSITLLLQDDVGGLEVEDPNHPGQFKPAPPVKDAIIVNAGDFLMRWSNDTIRSTIHRVRTPPHLSTKGGMTPERYSIPYFCATDLSAVVDCLPGSWSDIHPKRYEPISAGEYIMKRLAANY